MVLTTIYHKIYKKNNIENTGQNKVILDFKKMVFIKHKQLLIHYQYK